MIQGTHGRVFVRRKDGTEQELGEIKEWKITIPEGGGEEMPYLPSTSFTFTITRWVRYPWWHPLALPPDGCLPMFN